MFQKISGIAANFYNAFAAKGFMNLYKKLAEEITAEIKLKFPRNSFQGKNSKIKILDIGTGPGYLPIEIAKLNDQFEISGIDLSPKMINIANKNVRTIKTDRVKFKVADAHNLPYKDNTFNFIFSTFSFHHWKNKAKVFNECYRVVKNNGLIWIYDLKKDAPRKEIKKIIMSKSFRAWYLSWAVKFHGLKTKEWKSFNNDFFLKWNGALVCLIRKK